MIVVCMCWLIENVGCIFVIFGVFLEFFLFVSIFLYKFGLLMVGFGIGKGIVFLFKVKMNKNISIRVWMLKLK